MFFIVQFIHHLSFLILLLLFFGGVRIYRTTHMTPFSYGVSALFVASMLATAVCGTTQLPLANPSFNTGDTSGWIVEGVQTKVTVFNVTGAGIFLNDAAADGEFVAGIVRRQDVRFYQDLSDLLTADNMYTFACHVGRAIDTTGPDMRTISMQIRSANTDEVLANQTVTEADVIVGAMKQFHVSFTPTLAEHGTPIRVGFYSTDRGKIAYVDKCSLFFGQFEYVLKSF